MKVRAAIATMAIVTAIGTTQPQAGDKIAKLTDPATTGPTVTAPLGALEKASLPPAVARTGLSAVELNRIRTSIRGHIQALSQRDAAGVRRHAVETHTPERHHLNPGEPESGSRRETHEADERGPRGHQEAR